MTSATHPAEKLDRLIEEIRFAMLTTRDDRGLLRSRPMTTQSSSVDGQGELKFFMSRGSDALLDIQRDAAVNVAYADPDRDAYVSVSGEATEIDDPAEKKKLWSKLNEAWFPGGPTDPDLALVAVRVAHADYWDVKKSKVMQLLTMATAAVSGKPVDGGKLGEHEEIDLR